MPQSEFDSGQDSAPARILVVEDEPLVRFVIAEALRELGVTVVEAGTADEAWQYLATGEPIDLVFTDHRMPGSMSGAELAGKIQQQYPRLEIVVTSAYFNAKDWSAPVVGKPYNLLKTAADLAQRAIHVRRHRFES